MKRLGFFALAFITIAVFTIRPINQMLIDLLIAGIIPGTNAKINPYVIFMSVPLGIFGVYTLIKKLDLHLHLPQSSHPNVDNLAIHSTTHPR